MKKKIFAGVLVALLLVGGLGAFAYYRSHQGVEEVTDNTQKVEVKPPVDETPKTIRITAVGDNLPHDSINMAAKTGETYDYTPLYSEVKEYMNGDITYCNQESPSAGESLGISGYPTFNAPKEFSRDLNKVGCNVINLANNHIADKGQAGIDATLDVWAELNPLAYSGANKNAQDQLRPKYFEVNGKKFAFIAFTDLTNNTSIDPFSVNMFSNDLITQLASQASKNADYVIASAHWGVEDSSTVSPSQRGWAEAMANAGVDLILGEGPHVLQTVEVIKAEDGREVPVWYSLGNFLSSQLTTDQLVGGIAVIDLDISTGDIKLKDMSFMPSYMHYEWSAADAAAENLMARTNLKLYPLSKAAEPLSKSQNNTTVDEQMKRVQTLLNQNLKIEMIKP